MSEHAWGSFANNNRKISATSAAGYKIGKLSSPGSASGGRAVGMTDRTDRDISF